MADSIDMAKSVNNYRKKKRKIRRHQKYRRIGLLFVVLDWLVFAGIWLRNNIVSTSVHIYASDAFSYSKGILDPFFSFTYIFLGIYYFQSRFDYVDRERRYWKSFVTYLVPVLLGTSIVILTNGQFAYFISRMPKQYSDSVYFDYYSLFAVLISYGLIRILLTFDYYISYYIDNGRTRLFVFRMYIIAYILFLFASGWFPKLYPYV